MTDTTSLLNQTHREVGRRRIAAGEARTALMRRRYDAPIADVWDACTDPDRISRWFIKPTGDLRPGGTFSLEGNASGEILHCEPPRLLTVTWSYPSRPVDELELRLSPGEDGGHRARARTRLCRRCIHHQRSRDRHVGHRAWLGGAARLLG